MRFRVLFSALFEMRPGKLTCQQCAKSLTGRQVHWCSRTCRDRYRNAQRWAAGYHPGKGNGVRISDAKIAEVKERFPSCARDWDLEMVEKAWDRLTAVLPRKLAKLDRRT